MAHLLVLILTSVNARLCRRAYQSLTQDQLPHNLQVTVKVIVNSTNPHYVDAVRRALPQELEIIETKSNGLPGVGHNSCLDYFQQHPEYDYLFHLDGDDLVYDTALRTLELLIDCKPVFVGSTGLDRLTNLPNNPEQRGVPLGYGWFRTSANTDQVPDVWQKWPPTNPFQLPLHKTFTPSRPLLFSRAVFELPLPLRWSETLMKHDDYLVFLNALENQLQHNQKGIYFCTSTQVYVYNILNGQSSTKAKKIDFQQQQTAFNQETSHIQVLRREWDSIFSTPHTVKLLVVPPAVDAPEDHKTVHLQKHVVQFALAEIEKGDTLALSGDDRQALIWWEKALAEGLWSGALFLKMAAVHKKLGHTATAAALLQKAQQLPKTKEEATSELVKLQPKHIDTSLSQGFKSYLEICLPEF